MKSTKNIIFFLKEKLSLILGVMFFVISSVGISFYSSKEIMTLNSSSILSYGETSNRLESIIVSLSNGNKQLKINNGKINCDEPWITQDILDDNNIPLMSFRFQNVDKNETKATLNRLFMQKQKDYCTFFLFGKNYFFGYLYNENSALSADDYIIKIEGDYSRIKNGFDIISDLRIDFKQSSQYLINNVIDSTKAKYTATRFFLSLTTLTAFYALYFVFTIFTLKKSFSKLLFFGLSFISNTFSFVGIIFSQNPLIPLSISIVMGGLCCFAIIIACVGHSSSMLLDLGRYCRG